MRRVYNKHSYPLKRSHTARLKLGNRTISYNAKDPHNIHGKQLLAPVHRWWHQLSGNVQGALWMLLAGVGFTGMAVCIKLAGQTMPVFEIVVLRALFALIILITSDHPRRARLLSLVTARCPPAAQPIRDLWCHHYDAGTNPSRSGISHHPRLHPNLVHDHHCRFISRRVGPLAGTAATLVGFAGVVFCIQPGASGFDPWTVVGVASALFSAGVITMIKRLTSTEPPLRILVWSYVIMAILAAIPTIFMWKTPTLEEFSYIAAMGVFSAWGQSCMVNALRIGKATAVAPFEYCRLLFAAIIGFLLFAQTPTLDAWIGSALIVGSTLYITIREAHLKRQNKAPPSKTQLT